MSRVWDSVHSRRSLSALDANAPPLQPRPRPVRTEEEPTVYAPPARPARPNPIPADVLAEAARAIGMAPNEIIDVTDVDAGRIITTHDGSKVIVVPADRPDGAGQTGVLVYHWPGMGEIPKMARVYVDPRPAVPMVDTQGWSVAELDELARRERVPDLEYGLSRGPSRLPWVAGDPVKARAAWLHIAHRTGITPGEAAMRNVQEAADLRRIITDSGWLAAGELPRLDQRGTL